LSSNDPTSTALPVTAGDEYTFAPVAAVHSGLQVLGVPEQPVVPVASNAYTFAMPEPM
jgi:hypothetical protein